MNAGKAGVTLGGVEGPAGVGGEPALAAQMRQERPDRGGLAGGGAAGEAAGVEVREVAAQGLVVQGGGVGAAAPFGPGHELTSVVLVGPTRVLAATRERGDEAVDIPGHSQPR